MLLYSSFSKYTDAEKQKLRTFFISLANATYGTFKDVPMDSHILPKDYLKYIMSLHGNISYAISASYDESSGFLEFVPTITELGFCYTCNGEIAPYNNYKLVTRVENKIIFTCLLQNV